jgi:hypothetical protein
MTTKEKMHSIVDDMPDQTAQTALNILEELYWMPVIERVTDPDEIREINEDVAEMKADPSSYVTLDEFLEEMRA